MSGVIFWDEDTQIDFMLPEGSLYVSGAETLLPNLQRLTECARAHRVPIVAIMCDHTLDDAEISSAPDFQQTFPPHCLRGTRGHARVPATQPQDPVVFENRPWTRAAVAERLAAHRGEILIKKQVLDPFSNPATAWLLDLLAPSSVVVYGVVTECCVHRAVLGLCDGRRQVYVVEDAIMPLDPPAGARCIAEWRSRGAELACTDDVVGGRVVPLQPPTYVVS
jgi:nicotinamidase/pyrazinamidase